MTEPPHNPPRLVDQAGDPASARVARLLRAVEPVPPMAPTAVHRIEQRLAQPAPAPWRYRRLAWATAGLLLLATTGASAAYYHGAIASSLRHFLAPIPPLPAPWRAPIAPPAHNATEPPPAPLPQAEAPVPIPLQEPARPPRQIAPRTPRSHAQPSVDPETSTLARESETLGRAMTALRRENAPARALQVLDEYDQQFPAGALHTEAVVLRVDALVAAGDERAALARLTALPAAMLAPLPRLRLLRGELRARLGDCAQALGDFDALLALPAAGPLRGDALFGRASCRAKLGQTAEARVDYEHYLAAFPAGRHAANARAALGR